MTNDVAEIDGLREGSCVDAAACRKRRLDVLARRWDRKGRGSGQRSTEEGVSGVMGPVKQTNGPSFLPVEMFRYLPFDIGQLLIKTAQGESRGSH